MGPFPAVGRALILVGALSAPLLCLADKSGKAYLEGFG
jgi:hypothetical protein